MYSAFSLRRSVGDLPDHLGALLRVEPGELFLELLRPLGRDVVR
jgi:hypothetical protein